MGEFEPAVEGKQYSQLKVGDVGGTLFAAEQGLTYTVREEPLGTLVIQRWYQGVEDSEDEVHNISLDLVWGEPV
jgi:hypothetical protein